MTTPPTMASNIFGYSVMGTTAELLPASRSLPRYISMRVPQQRRTRAATTRSWHLPPQHTTHILTIAMTVNIVDLTVMGTTPQFPLACQSLARYILIKVLQEQRTCGHGDTFLASGCLARNEHHH